ncbi:hypothetical protein Cfor_12026 [Coptotermes formosanus]|uniref:Uncharacterized protein n=1 Tax=Coptotermes formosanus TaxID=36987 RepID=A0A6L2Q7D2_COPFO|nr:hypothetical protein Cfor_12026 [Coptotermes formosanus]
MDTASWFSLLPAEAAVGSSVTPHYEDSMWTAAEQKTQKQEARPLPAPPPMEAQKASKAQKITESKPEKRGAHGQEENLAPFKEDSGGGVGLKTEVAHHNPIVTEKVVHVHVPVPQPYPVEHFRHIPYPVKVPVPVVVHKPFPVPVPSPFHVIVEKKEPFPAVKHVPYYVKTPAEVLGKVPVEVPIPEQYTLPVSKIIPLPVPQSDIKQRNLYISQHSQNQEIHKPELYKETQPEESAPEDNYYAKISNIPETRLSETYKVLIPEENYKGLTLPETHQYQILPNYQQSSIPGAYHQEAKAPGISSHEFNIFGGHEAGFLGIGYLSQGHGGEGHGSSYQSVNTH